MRKIVISKTARLFLQKAEDLLRPSAAHMQKEMPDSVADD